LFNLHGITEVDAVGEADIIGTGWIESLINPVIAEVALDCDLSILVKTNGMIRAFIDAKLTPRSFLVIKDDNPVFPFRYGLHYCFLSPGGVTPSFPLPI